MPVKQELIEMLCCPEERRPLRLMAPDDLRALNRAIATGHASDAGGARVVEAIESGLATVDGASFYPVQEGVPVLVSGTADHNSGRRAAGEPHQPSPCARRRLRGVVGLARITVEEPKAARASVAARHCPAPTIGRRRARRARCASRPSAGGHTGDRDDALAVRDAVAGHRRIGGHDPGGLARRRSPARRIDPRRMGGDADPRRRLRHHRRRRLAGFPAVPRRLFRGRRRGAPRLRDDGFVATRVYTRPETREPLEAIFADLRAGRIGSLEFLWWRLYTAQHGGRARGALAKDIWEAWAAYVPDPAGLIRSLGWPPEDLQAMESLRSSPHPMIFPTLREFRDDIAGSFEEIACESPDFEDGDRNPTLVLKARPR